MLYGLRRSSKLAHYRINKIIVHLVMVGTILVMTAPTSAAIVTLTFDALNPGTTYHSQTISESGYTLTSTTQIRSVKPSNVNSNGTTSIFTQATGLTITHGPLNNLVFDVLSINFGELFSSGTPVVGYSGVKSDNSVVSGQFVVSGAPSFWNYDLAFGAPFTGLVSFTLGYNSPYLYQIDNIELSSAFTITDNLSPNPLPETLPMFALGAFTLFLISRRKHKA